MYIVGLDLSLRSPGFAVYNLESDQWDLYGFKQNQKSVEGLSGSDKCNLCLLPLIPSKCEDTVVYNHILYYLKLHILDRLKDQSVLFIIEGYAFSKQHNAGYKLQELGGVIKSAIFNGGFQQRVLPPTYWKKLLTGKGNCTKLEVFQHLHSPTSSSPSLIDLFNLDVNRTTTIPHPIEDIADAVGLILASRIEGQTTQIQARQNKKRKKPSSSTET